MPGGPAIPPPPEELLAAAAGLFAGAGLAEAIRALQELFGSDQLPDRSAEASAASPSWANFYGKGATSAGWIIECGSEGGQYSRGEYYLCPIQPSDLISTPYLSTPPIYDNFTKCWYAITYNSLYPEFLPPDHTPPDLSRVKHVGHMYMPVTDGGVNVPSSPLGGVTFTYPVPNYGERDWQGIATGPLGQVETLPIASLPARDELQEVVQPLTERGYVVEGTGQASWTGAWWFVPGVGLVREAVYDPPARPAPGAIAYPPLSAGDVDWPASAGNTIVLELPGEAGIPQIKVEAPAFVPPSPEGPSQPAQNKRKQRVRVAGPESAAASLGVLGSSSLRLFGFATEACDAVEAIFNAVPLKKRLAYGVTKHKPRKDVGDKKNLSLQKRIPHEKLRPKDYRGVGNKEPEKFYSDKQNVGCLKQANFLAHGGYRHVDWGQALVNLALNEVKDRGIGLLSSAGSSAWQKVQARIGGPAMKSPYIGPTL